VYCSHCEKDMPKDFKFCPVCGSIPPAPKSPPPPEPNYNPRPPQQPNYNPRPPPEPNYNPRPPQQPNYNPQYQAGYKSIDTATILAAVLGFLGLSGVGHMYVGRVGRGVGLLIGILVLDVIGLATIWFGVGIIFLIAGLAMYIWHIFDVRNLCREYNNYLSQNGQPPW